MEYTKKNIETNDKKSYVSPQIVIEDILIENVFQGRGQGQYPSDIVVPDGPADDL